MIDRFNVSRRKLRGVALVPMRGGSKGIRNKNVIDILGKPLCFYSLDALVQSGVFDKIVVSTDSDLIEETVEALQLGVEIYRRPSMLGGDNVSTEDVIRDFLDHYSADFVVLAQITSPLITSENVKEVVHQYKTTSVDSIVSVVRFKRFIWSADAQPLNYSPLKRPRRQDFSGSLVENGAIYIFSPDGFLNNNSRLHGKIGLYEMTEENFVEVDELNDLHFVRLQLLKRAAS